MQFTILKIKNFYRSLAFCLVFLISFSIFSFGFYPEKQVNANPLIGVAESEVVAIIVNILSSFGVVVSLPTARDFLQEEQKFCEQKALELQNHKGAVSKGIQALQEGYYVSKEFITDVLDRWEKYCIKNKVDVSIVNNVYTINFPSVRDTYGRFFSDDEYHKYVDTVLCSHAVYVPSDIDSFTISFKRYGVYYHDYQVSNSGRTAEYFGKVNNFILKKYNLFFAPDCWLTGPFLNDCSGVKIEFGSYKTKPQVNKKVIDNTLNPVNPQSQGMVISPKQVEAVGKVLNPSIPDVDGVNAKDFSIDNTAPISSVASTVPRIATGADIGALPWSNVGSIDKPVDIPKDESKDIPKDESKDIPKDESKDIPKDEPTDKPKEGEGVDFSPFLTLGAGLKEVFPFCLPFDLIKNLHLLSAPPQTPKFDIDFKKAGLAGGEVVTIDFSQFELLARIIRFFLTLGFIYFLIIKTRDMIRG